jgi:hypothetical protein
MTGMDARRSSRIVVTRIALGLLTLGLLAAAVLASPAGALLVPGPNGSAPTFSGAPATQHPVYYAAPPQNPFMAPADNSNVHDDAYMSNTYQEPGPLGRGDQVLTLSASGVCGSVTFDTSGRIVSVCVGPAGPTLEMIDPKTLTALATFSLPPRNLATTKTLNIFQDFGGGGYFYLDNKNEAVIPTTTHHVYVVAETGSTPGFTLAHDYDLTSVMSSSDEITSVVPDWSGRLWFVTFDGVVGTIDPATGAVHASDTHEETENSFSVDQTGGVFIVTDKAMYRYDAGPGGQPEVSWRAVYPNSGIHKPGQVDAGSGTTPTLMGSDYVAITDNADPMDIVVYKRAKIVTGNRVVCTQPVFDRGASDTENSLIGTDRSMIVENNYGYQNPTSTEQGKTTAPGLERVDINASGSGCHVVWTSAEAAPTVVPKLSLSSGLVYTYTKGTETTDPWYLTALDFASGRTVYKQLAGSGIAFNNNYAPVSLGPNGSAYVGVLGGLVEIHDTSPPRFLHALVPASELGVKLHIRRLARHRLRLTVTIASTAKIARVRYRYGRRAIATCRRAPFALVVALTPAQLRHLGRLHALVRLRDGRTVSATR